MNELQDELFDMFILYAFGVQIQNSSREWDYTFHFKGGLDNFELIRDLYGKCEEYVRYLSEESLRILPTNYSIHSWRTQDRVSPIKITITVEE